MCIASRYIGMSLTSSKNPQDASQAILSSFFGTLIEREIRRRTNRSKKMLDFAQQQLRSQAWKLSLFDFWTEYEQ